MCREVLRGDLAARFEDRLENPGTISLAANQGQVGADDVTSAIMAMARGAERELRMGEEAAGDVEVGLSMNGV